MTRSGSNEFHGSGYFFFRDHNMAAYPNLARDPKVPDPFFARRQPGVWMGGPIKKDKLFFFFNYEHTNQVQAVSINTTTPSFQPLTGTYGSPYTARVFSGKIDYRLSAKNSSGQEGHRRCRAQALGRDQSGQSSITVCIQEEKSTVAYDPPGTTIRVTLLRAYSGGLSELPLSRSPFVYRPKEGGPTDHGEACYKCPMRTGQDVHSMRYSVPREASRSFNPNQQATEMGARLHP